MMLCLWTSVGSSTNTWQEHPPAVSLAWHLNASSQAVGSDGIPPYFHRHVDDFTHTSDIENGCFF